MSGSCSASCGQGGVQPRLVARVAGHDGGLQRRRREVVLARAVRARPDHVADLDPGQAGELGDLARGHRIAAFRGAVGEDADRGHLAVAASVSGPLRRTAAAERHAVPDRDRAGEQAGVGDLVACGPRSTLKTRPETGRSASPPAAGSRRARPRSSASTPAPVMADPKNTGCTSVSLTWPASFRRSQPAWRRRLVVEVGGEDRVVVLGQHLGQPRRDGRARAVVTG